MAQPDRLPDAPAEGGDDTEGHAFKWQLEDDPKGGKRLRQRWDPQDGPPGRPSSTATESAARTTQPK